AWSASVLLSAFPTVVTEAPVVDRDAASASAAIRDSSPRLPCTRIITKSPAPMPDTRLKRLLITNLPILSAPQGCRRSPSAPGNRPGRRRGPSRHDVVSFVGVLTR